MGWINPAEPTFDVEDWKKRRHLDKIKPLSQEWATEGFGTPYAINVLYLLKLVAFTFAAAWVIGKTTPGLAGDGAIGEIENWWNQPIVLQKFVVFMVLYEFMGMGSSSGPLSFRFLPPIGGPLFWLRPGALRLPPWPDKVPFTKGSTRTPFDVLLALGVYTMCVILLLSDGIGRDGYVANNPEVVTTGFLDPALIGALLGIIFVLSLRDKVSALSTRPEVYGALLLLFMLPVNNMVVGAQIVLFVIWFGAALSKVNFHFGYVVSVMVSNTVWNRSRKFKKHLWADYPNSIKPSWKSEWGAHFGAVQEIGFPILMLIGNGGIVTWVGVIGMTIFHIHITSTFPLAVPLEWNLFMIFGIWFLFAENSAVAWSSMDWYMAPLLIAFILLPIIGNMRPDKISFLPAMRYYAGNWATSQWLFNKPKGIEERFDKEITKSSPLVITQLTKLYDRDTAELTLYKGLAFRAMHSHGRALNSLLPVAVDKIDDYDIREGEFMAGSTIGWNFGDAHFHHWQLLEAVQEQMNLDEGDIRVIFLESQPIQIQEQRYKIFDVKTGLLEEGIIQVEDMRKHEPWLDENWGSIPREVTYRAKGFDGEIRCKGTGYIDDAESSPAAEAAATRPQEA